MLIVLRAGQSQIPEMAFFGWDVNNGVVTCFGVSSLTIFKHLLFNRLKIIQVF